jgi:SAM-dependent methyltransferase
MPRPIFVASPTEVYYDEDAKNRLQHTNDTRFYDPRVGITRVDEDRWRQAQEYEFRTWIDFNPGANSDRNDEHAAGFGDYAALPSELGDVLELGCGVFTNIRTLLAKGHLVDSITLVDPLLTAYVERHPNCSYKHGAIAGIAVQTIAQPIEVFKPTRQYDTVIFVNVLTHCYDADKIFDVIHASLKPGGWLVFHEAPTTLHPSEHYDVGHPLVVAQSVIDKFLGEFMVVSAAQNGYFIGRAFGEQQLEFTAPIAIPAVAPQSTLIGAQEVTPETVQAYQQAQVVDNPPFDPFDAAEDDVQTSSSYVPDDAIPEEDVTLPIEDESPVVSDAPAPEVKRGRGRPRKS